ncbi:MAG: bifunctional folylpolyglutamate synthase/dihydrofolate synthase [Chloroflexi bacterium]|nr:bifunctional folylpolyglutamate synthase/dihydrofolate synthase [Chloroflexota bacterium]
MLDYEQTLAVLMRYASRMPQKPGTQDAQRPARARALLAAMGEPHLRYPLLHVTGTKGKGSVCAMCAAVLRAHGLRVGMYTSPHLQDVRERFLIDGQMVSRAALSAAVTTLAPIFERISGARWPEVMATLALYLFAQHEVDISVVEVSVGGRLDATNVVYPAVSVITRIGYDHMHLLGDTLDKIAWEKAGIIKAGTPAVSAPQQDEARVVLERAAEERSAPFTLVGREVEFEADLPTAEGQRVKLRFPGGESRAYVTALLGAHQAQNAAVAVAALQQLQIVGLQVSERALENGLRRVFWPGRLEVVGHEPLLLLDSAHNPESAQRLVEALQALFPQRPFVLVFGAKTTKDISGTLGALLPLADQVILTRSGDGMTDAPARLAQIAQGLDRRAAVQIREDVGAALDVARKQAGRDGLVCVTGSMFIVGEVRTLLGLHPV